MYKTPNSLFVEVPEIGIKNIGIQKRIHHSFEVEWSIIIFFVVGVIDVVGVMLKPALKQVLVILTLEAFGAGVEGRKEGEVEGWRRVLVATRWRRVLAW